MIEKVNYYKNVEKPPVVKTIDINDWFNQIRTPHEKYKYQILSARLEGKYDEDGNKSEFYDNIKSNIPCITYNFLFDKYKNDKNIIGSTGLLFIDVDSYDFDINIVDKNKIFSYYHSLDGKGYHIIIKVNNLTINNFKETYLSICNDLNILDYIDKNVIRKTQFTVLSFDENIYINDNCFIYDSLENNKIKLNKKVSPFNKKEREIGRGDTFSRSKSFIKIKFKTELEEYDENCVFINEGKEYIECFVPFSISENKRLLKDGQKHTVLSSYINNFILLNPNISREQLISVINNLVNRVYSLKIPFKNILKIIDYKMKQHEDGLLEPINEKLKRFWVNPECTNKLQVYNEKQSEPTKLLLLKFFDEDINEIKDKITNKMIAHKTGLSEITIKRRLTNEMKEIIKTFNKNL